MILYICTPIIAGMVKLVDTPDLGSGAARCEGSSPFIRTIGRKTPTVGTSVDFLFLLLRNLKNHFLLHFYYKLYYWLILFKTK